MKVLYKEKEQAIKMRLGGMSYSQIKNVINVSKSTLSIWLQKYPLSEKRIKELRDWNPRRIENCRNTKLRKRQKMLSAIYENVAKEIGSLSNRDLFIAGLFLYWGEGTKASRSVVAFTNTDPAMLRLFIQWLNLMGVKNSSLKVKLHLYVDMKIKEKTLFWSKELDISLNNFAKPYIKDSKFTSLTYKSGFGCGTCSVIYANAELHNKIMMSLRYLREVVSTK
jgi:hypothetical protein